MARFPISSRLLFLLAALSAVSVLACSSGPPEISTGGRPTVEEATNFLAEAEAAYLGDRGLLRAADGVVGGAERRADLRLVIEIGV